nr:MAG TPA_asm: hypothetical protein [Caudoviricetes sp.]
MNNLISARFLVFSYSFQGFRIPLLSSLLTLQRHIIFGIYVSFWPFIFACRATFFAPSESHGTPTASRPKTSRRKGKTPVLWLFNAWKP